MSIKKHDTISGNLNNKAQIVLNSAGILKRMKDDISIDLNYINVVINCLEQASEDISGIAQNIKNKSEGNPWIDKV